MKLSIPFRYFLPKFKFLILIAAIGFTLQGCFFGEDQAPTRHICDGISNALVPDATQSECREADGEWFEGEGCYCH